MTPSPDALATLCLCSRLAVAKSAGAETFPPAKWADLSRHMATARIAGPGALIGKASAAIAESLGVSAPEGERIARLLERGPEVESEVARLRAMGIAAITETDGDYPESLSTKLGHRAPPVLFVAGRRGLLGEGGLAVVGSRDAGDALTLVAARLGALAARSHKPLISGGARGIDSAAMSGAREAGGAVVGVLAESLESAVRAGALGDDEARSVLVTIQSPAAGFSVGAAMERNKVIYALADFAVVVSSAANSGGTWAGAVEALRSGATPVFVVDRKDAPEGNALLIRKGATALPDADVSWPWLASHACAPRPATGTKALFATP
ncbi:MAG: DNA-processing protein DprA [Planctomycetes bacterium]|nr:DNA-processing protein DprA [Planctomycetota bacterium]